MRKVLLFVASLLYIGTAQAQLIEYRDETDINSAHYLDNLLSKMTLEERWDNCVAPLPGTIVSAKATMSC